MVELSSMVEQIPANIFRAYDIRGAVELGGLTTQIAYLIGLAIGSEVQALDRQQVVIARDGRLSGVELTTALAQGLMASGCYVVDIGMVPTPVLYFATKHLTTDSGVMLTGSHNPKNHNGFKIALAGKTISKEGIQDIYKRILAKNFKTGAGEMTTLNIKKDYLNAITQRLNLQRTMKIVIDCGNGVAGELAPLLFQQLGCEVETLYGDIDGSFPNHHPDPTQPENLQDLIQAVLTNRADLGLAFDGDGDRLGVVSNQGDIIWADRLMMLFAIDLLMRSPKASILFDVKCSNNLTNVITSYGGTPIMYQTGHSLIKGKMQEDDILLAGEMSGHLFFKENWFGFDDALYAGARLLSILSQETRSISEIFSELPNSMNTPELKLPVAEEAKIPMMRQLLASKQFSDGKRTTIDGLRVDFEYGWGLVRPSNTTANLVFRFEADTTENLEKIKSCFRAALFAVDNKLQLPF